MTGFRIGYACGPQSLIEAMMKVHQYSMLCAPILSKAAIEALKNGAPAVAEMKDAYHKRRDLIVRRFNKLASTATHLKESSTHSHQSSLLVSTLLAFAKDLIERKSLLFRAAFGPNGAGFVRASFSTSYERILEATDRIERYMNSIQT